MQHLLAEDGRDAGSTSLEVLHSSLLTMVGLPPLLKLVVLHWDHVN